MSPEQMLPGHMSRLQLKSIQDGPFKIGQNRVSNSQDIPDNEFVLEGGGWTTVMFMSDPILAYVSLCLG